MISIKRYMEGDLPPEAALDEAADMELLDFALAAYGSAMQSMGHCSLVACPSLGNELKNKFDELSVRLSHKISPEVLNEIDQSLQKALQNWGHRATRYYRDKAAEVKELLLVMAQTAEAVGTRDERYGAQMTEVTAQLRKIATLDDVTEIRASLEIGAAEFKSSIDRMAAEGRAAVEELRRQVKTYQEKLEDAEELASRDPLTGVRNRLCIEALIDERIAAEAEFCVAMIDIDGFKAVNDTYGHVIGDELLKMFAIELRSACRSSDVIGRWGGDEFILICDCGLSEATTRVERLFRWVCGDYTVRSSNKTLKLRVSASMGLADHRREEMLQTLIARADAAMYKCKAASRTSKMPAVAEIVRA